MIFKARFGPSRMEGLKPDDAAPRRAVSPSFAPADTRRYRERESERAREREKRDGEIRERVRKSEREKRERVRQERKT